MTTFAMPSRLNTPPVCGDDQLTLAPVERAEERDRADLSALLVAAYPATSPHTVWDLPWTWASFRVIRGLDGRVAACAMLDDLDGVAFELRGVTVSHAARGQGLASRLVAALLDEADAAGRETVCMTRRPSFFERFGFHRTTPEWLPRERWLPAPDPSAQRVAMRRPARTEAVA